VHVVCALACAELIRRGTACVLVPVYMRAVRVYACCTCICVLCVYVCAVRVYVCCV